MLDVGVTSDGGLRTAVSTKKAKYGAPAAASSILRAVRLDHPNVRVVRQCPIILTWRGLAEPDLVRKLAGFDLPRYVFHDLVWAVIRGGLKTYHQYFRSTFVV